MSQFFLAFDTETGGFEPEDADLLTAYFCITDENFKILEELDLKLKPDGDRLPIADAGALKVNGINIKDHLANPETISYSEAKPKITTLIKKFLKKNGRFSNIIPLGFNISFDIKWVKGHLIPKKEWESMVHYKEVDVMKDVDFLKRVGWFPKEIGNLSSVVKYLQIPERNAHTAKDDTLMTLDANKKILEIMKSKKDGGQVVDLIGLLEAE